MASIFEIAAWALISTDFFIFTDKIRQLTIGDLPLKWFYLMEVLILHYIMWKNGHVWLILVNLQARANSNFKVAQSFHFSIKISDIQQENIWFVSSEHKWTQKSHLGHLQSRNISPICCYSCVIVIVWMILWPKM